MNPQPFINKWSGKFVPSRGGITGQCVSLVQRWSEDNGVTGTPVFPVAYAYQMVGARPDYFTWEPNRLGDPGSRPIAGDIVVFNQSYGGGAGHTGVVVSSDGYTMAVFQQNDPFNSTAHIKSYNFNGCSGWLRLKGGTMEKVTTEINRIIHTEMEGWPYHDTHAGKHDDKIKPAWNGRSVSEMIWEKWNKNGGWRDEREAALAYYRVEKPKQDAEIAALKARVAELEASQGSDVNYKRLKEAHNTFRELLG